MYLRLSFLSLLLGFLLDCCLGDPAWLYHPVRLIGAFISKMETFLRHRGNLRRNAVWLTLSTVSLTMLVVSILLFVLSRLGTIPLHIGMSLLDWMGIAARSMITEAKGVKHALSISLDSARTQVARIVGRDTQCLSREEIICATVETVAENTTDGVISPMLYALLGPVALWGLKAASTLDSMVGYLDDHYRDIGWFSARLDDVLNFIPARLTALLMICASAVAGLDFKNAARIVSRDHANHLSPNCAWSEAAAAGALHIQLGGTHTYFGKPIEKPTIGDPDRAPASTDITASCILLYLSAICLLLILTLIEVILL